VLAAASSSQSVSIPAVPEPVEGTSDVQSSVLWPGFFYGIPGSSPRMTLLQYENDRGRHDNKINCRNFL